MGAAADGGTDLMRGTTVVFALGMKPIPLALRGGNAMAVLDLEVECPHLLHGLWTQSRFARKLHQVCMALSTGAKTFLFVTVASLATAWYVQWSDNESRRVSGCPCNLPMHSM